MTTVETELAAARMLPKALALATEPARRNGPVALPIFHEDPARLRRERTTHRLFYSSHFLTKVCCRDTCSVSVRSEICVVQLRERWGRAPRDRLSGAGPKPFQAAAVKSRGGERWSESSRKTLGR